MFSQPEKSKAVLFFRWNFRIKPRISGGPILIQRLVRARYPLKHIVLLMFPKPETRTDALFRIDYETLPPTDIWPTKAKACESQASFQTHCFAALSRAAKKRKAPLFRWKLRLKPALQRTSGEPRNDIQTQKSFRTLLRSSHVFEAGETEGSTSLGGIFVSKPASTRLPANQVV